MNLLRAAIRGIVQSAVDEAAAKRRDVELSASDVAKEAVRERIQDNAYKAISKGVIIDDKSLRAWLLKQPADDSVSRSAILALQSIPFEYLKIAMHAQTPLRKRK